MFGKSTNLHMIKQFLSKQSIKNGQIRETFAKLKIYKNHRQFFDNNFGQWSVLFVDFKSTGIVRHLEDAVEQFKISIRHSYEEHDYLLNSPHLRESDKTLVKNWMTHHKSMTRQDTEQGLQNLAIYLNKHFNKSVVFLVDEYDSIINKAFFRVNDNMFYEDMLDCISSILGNVLKSSAVDVELAVVTGLSYITSCGLSHIDNLKRYRFLENHRFVQFYGFTQKEVDSLFEKKEFHLDSKEIKKAHSLYSGYSCRVERNIYNTFSVLTFIEEREARNHSLVTGLSTNLVNCFTFPAVENNIGRLLMGETIKIHLHYDIDIHQIFDLRKTFFKEQGFEELNVDLIFCYLLEFGLLAHDTEKKINNSEVYVKFPNLEVHNDIFRLFKDFYVNQYHLRREDVSNVTNYSELRKFRKGKKGILNSIAERLKKYFNFNFSL